MRLAPTLKSCAILGVLAATASAQSAPKVYGFADVRFSKAWSEDNNLLIPEGYLKQEANFYLGHVNPYIDWNPHENVRTLVEMNLNPQGTVSNSAGTRLKLSAAGEAELRSVLTPVITGQVTQQLIAQGMPANVAAQQAPAIAAPIIEQTVQGVKANSEIMAGQPEENKRTEFFELERAQIDLKISDALNVRVGKFLTPVGIWSVDHGSPVILTVQQPYYLSTIPVFPKSQEGVMLFGTTPIGDNDLSYSLYVSKGRDDANRGNLDISDWDDLSVGGQTYVKVEALNGTRFGVSGYVGRDRKDDLWGDATYELGMLKDMPGGAPDDLAPLLPMLRNDTLFLDEVTYSTTRTRSLREFNWNLDMKTNVGPVGLQAEVSGAHIVNDLDPDQKTSSAFDYYLLASYDVPVNEAISLTPYLFYEELTWADQDNTPGWSLGLQGFPLDGFRVAALGLNTSLWSNVRLKTEYSMVWLLPNPQSSHPIFRNKYTEDDLFTQSFQAQLAVAF